MAFYRVAGKDRYVASELTRGPWDAGSQHAGPPAALLGRAVEAAARPGMRVARLTFDIARPVPIGELTVSTSVLRAGRSVQVVSAAIEPYMSCVATLIRSEPGAAPPSPLTPPAATLDAAVDQPFFQLPYDVGYHTAMEFRFDEGSFLSIGPATGWMRMRVPLIDGEEPSPLARVLVAADSGNGISNVLDFGAYLFVNADLTVHLHRYPQGDWVRLRSATTISGDGIGMTDTALHDEQGPLGRAAQSLYVAPRR